VPITQDGKVVDSHGLAGIEALEGRPGTGQPLAIVPLPATMMFVWFTVDVAEAAPDRRAGGLARSSARHPAPAP
jgi:hypothetical protein